MENCFVKNNVKLLVRTFTLAIRKPRQQEQPLRGVSQHYISHEWPCKVALEVVMYQRFGSFGRESKKKQKKLG